MCLFRTVIVLSEPIRTNQLIGVSTASVVPPAGAGGFDSPHPTRKPAALTALTPRKSRRDGLPKYSATGLLARRLMFMGISAFRDVGGARHGGLDAVICGAAAQIVVH